MPTRTDAVKTLAETRAVAVLPIAAPRHHEVAVPVRRDRGTELSTARVRVHPELAAECATAAREALGEDTKFGTVVRIAVPNDHEITAWADGDCRGLLIPVRVD